MRIVIPLLAALAACSAATGASALPRSAAEGRDIFGLPLPPCPGIGDTRDIRGRCIRNGFKRNTSARPNDPRCATRPTRLGPQRVCLD